MTATGHDYRVKKAREALDAVFSDTSVGWETTLASLEELKGCIDERVDTLEDEHRNED